MQITISVHTNDELAFVDTFDDKAQSVTGLVVLLTAEKTTVELLKPGWRVVIQEIPK